MKALALSLLLLFGLCCYANADDADLCRLFKDGTQLRKPGSCQEYLTCQSGRSELSACVTPALYSNAKQSCVETAATADEVYCADRCQAKENNGRWIADLTSCHGFFYCQNGVSLYGFCPEGYNFDEATQMCLPKASSKCVDVADICQIAPNGAKFRDETSCVNYYTCSNNKLTNTPCKTGYFDVVTGDCVDKHLVQCAAHPYPKDVCGKDGSAKSGKFVTDAATCRGYFYCADLGYVADLAPAWGLCEEGKFFNAKTQGCDDPKDVICTFNRCEGRGTRFVQSHKNDCHDFIECVDSMPVAEHTCVGDLFFDEVISACAKKIIYYESCDHKW